jgi:hypothetical protein
MSFSAKHLAKNTPGPSRVAAGNGLGTGLGTTAKYARRTARGAAGNGIGTAVKYQHAQGTAFRAAA